MGYDVELKNITLQEYKTMLKKQNLLAARRILRENIDEHFDELDKSGIKNLQQLSDSIDNSENLEALSVKTQIPPDYLAILKRELSGIIKKPVLIADFPYIPPDTFKKLGENCVQTSKDFYELTNDGRDIHDICSRTKITEESAKELCSLCDFIRINAVGPVFARVLFESGFRSIEEIASSSASDILDRVTEVNDARKITRVLLGENEIQMCIDFAKILLRAK